MDIYIKSYQNYEIIDKNELFRNKIISLNGKS